MNERALSSIHYARLDALSASPRMNRKSTLLSALPTLFGLSALCTLAPETTAGDFPAHSPLRILIVSDEVNPHGLTPAELSGPGDLTAAITNPMSGLSLGAGMDAVLEIGTDQIAAATTALSVAANDPAAYDVLIYFAHRIPNGASGPADQAAFVAAVEIFLEDGGGVVSFHHGLYLTPGKAGILDVIGGTAQGSVPWNTVSGQDVINVAPSHFVTTHEVEYTQNVSYADVPRGVAAGTFDFFNNTPDERYPDVEINLSAEQVELLFASNYNQGGATHVLGFVHQRASWLGRVVAYQPGEYQPNALDDLDGNNFQILGNAILYAADAVSVLQFADICNGDGGDQLGCTNCPCMNNAPAGTIGGCLNRAGTSARLAATGDTSVSLPPGVSTDLRFTLAGAPPGALCVLLSGSAVAPTGMLNPCLLLNSGVQSFDRDGLRCAVMNLRRHGNRSADGMGEIMNASGPNRVWGGEAQPNGGLAVQGGFAAGQTRYFQVTHREDSMLGCMRGLNTSQAVEALFTP